MLKKFYPNAYCKEVFDIPLDALKKKKIKGLIFDIDNTLASYDTKEPDEKTIAFFERALKEGFLICLLSNNSAKRVTLFNEKLKVNAVSRANKPLRSGLRKAMSLLGTNAGNTVIIGDQIFTDIWCGNRAGIRTILVEPHSERDEWITKIKRGLEKIVISKYLESRRK